MNNIRGSMAIHVDSREPFPAPRSAMSTTSLRPVNAGEDSDRPMNLLDLPVDIVSVIIREITHTNDLTALALTHSALHRLVIPYIYSRFDIVWPEANPTMESRVGVDALTYGLATLVMAHDVFGEAPHQQECRHCKHCPCQPRRESTVKTGTNVRIRRGNYFAQHTRKFSLGNGPADWVQEYLITKEGGKMLGTLVALAIGRMRNLETFVWDMPTGVLRDVWLALASLDNRNHGLETRLEKVWVRWHDNREMASIPPASAPTSNAHHGNLPTLLHGTATSLFQIPAYPSVEFPTFSILPPLKSITCLDIDESSYAEELGILIKRSVDKLEELRVGVAYHAQRHPAFRPAENRPDAALPLAPDDGCQRLGGLFDLLFSGLHSVRDVRLGQTDVDEVIEASASSSPVNDHHVAQGGKSSSHALSTITNEVDQLDALMAVQSLEDTVTSSSTQTPTPRRLHNPKRREVVKVVSTTQSAPVSTRRLEIKTLDLERVYLSIPVLSRAIDWTKLQSITLLGCTNHETLWKALRKAYTPQSVRQRTPSSRASSLTGRPRTSSLSYPAAEASEYRLNVKRLHTDTVSKALLAFIKDTLAPDTLEWLFLQETPTYKSTVTIDDIYRSAVRRHRASLRKLLIDSDLRQAPNRSSRERERQTEDTNWRRWTANQDLLSCVTSDKMQLRELSISIDWRDWHFFVRQLPDAPTIRSLHISHIAEHTYGRSFEPREIALNILDFISLRSEMELCYLGIEKKCFEILEYKAQHARQNSSRLQTDVSHDVPVNPLLSPSYQAATSASDSEEHDDGGAAHHLTIDSHAAVAAIYDHDAADEEDTENWDLNSTATSDMDQPDRTDDSSNESYDDNDDDEEEEDEERDSDEIYHGAGKGKGKGKSKRKPAFRLREILFYDDKISIFKARHGKL